VALIDERGQKREHADPAARANPTPFMSENHCIMHFLNKAKLVPSSLPIVERNASVFLKARFALAAEHPEHDANKGDNENQKIDRRFYGCSPR
jgi:hypothetical protein